MKHFSAARQDSLAALQNAVAAATCAKACLLVDLDGRFRVLVHLDAGMDLAAGQSLLAAGMAAAGDIFWTGEIWIDYDKTYPAPRVAPASRALYDAVWEEAAKAQPPLPAFQQVMAVERRYSKETWFSEAGEVWPHVVENGASKSPPIVSFYSFKGGAGRSTALAAVAIQNARARRQVLIIDFDLEAPGMVSIFPPSGSTPEVGLVDYLLEQPLAGNGFDPAEAVYTFDDKSVVGEGGIQIVQAGVLDDRYLEKLARLNYLRLGKLNPGAPEPPLARLLKTMRINLKPDLILVDSRAGLDDIGGLALSPMAHFHVLFGTHSQQSWNGLRIAINHIGRQRVLAGKSQLDCLLVQAHVHPQNTEGAKRDFRNKAYEVFTEAYYDDVGNATGDWPVPDSEAVEQPHFPVPIIHDYRLMGYDSISTIANYLCEGDYKGLADRLNSALATA